MQSLRPAPAAGGGWAQSSPQTRADHGLTQANATSSGLAALSLGGSWVQRQEVMGSRSAAQLPTQRHTWKQADPSTQVQTPLG